MFSCVWCHSKIALTWSWLKSDCLSNLCLGVPAAYAPRGHRPVLSPAGVHAHSTPHPSRGLRTLLLWWAAWPQRQTAQWKGEAFTFQFHHPGYAHTQNRIHVDVLWGKYTLCIAKISISTFRKLVICSLNDSFILYCFPCQTDCFLLVVHTVYN